MLHVEGWLLVGVDVPVRIAEQQAQHSGGGMSEWWKIETYGIQTE